MSFTISTSDIKETYEKRKQFESLTDAAIEFLDGCAAYKQSSNGSYAQKGAILQIFNGIFSFANELIPGECGGWTIELGQKILEWFKEQALHNGSDHNIETELCDEYYDALMSGNDENERRAQAALEAWESLSEDELISTIDNMLGIYEDVTTDGSEKFDYL